MTNSAARARLRKAIEAHMDQLGYSQARRKRAGSPAPEILRVSPVRGRLAYGETVLHADLQSRRCHERLLFFSSRRTRQRSSILFFISVAEADRPELDVLLAELGIRTAVRGGHVHVISVPLTAERPQRTKADSQAARHPS